MKGQEKIRLREDKGAGRKEVGKRKGKKWGWVKKRTAFSGCCVHQRTRDLEVQWDFF